MKYTLIRRKKCTNAPTNKEFVKWMRKSDLQYFDTNEEFMKAYSIRKKTFEGILLRFDNENNFVEDLVKNNRLKIENNEYIFGFLKKK